MDLLGAPGLGVFDIVPSDITNLPQVARAIYVGGAGNISLVAQDGSAATIENYPAGHWLPVRTRRINETGTSATSLVGTY